MSSPSPNQTKLLTIVFQLDVQLRLDFETFLKEQFDEPPPMSDEGKPASEKFRREQTRTLSFLP